MDVPLAEDREFAMLDDEQISTLNAVERMGASLSLTGILLIFVTFAIFKRLRTIPNTFIFFASIANIGACVACMIGYDGITAMGEDRSSPLCQAQGFIFEWFMQSDPWWSFAMAINVYMVFFMSFNPTTFRHYLWVYCIICYGLPAIPAFVFLFVRMPKGLIYGDAVLWCWIASQWNALRIYSYYLPIWVCSVLSAIIYIAVGYHVFHQRNQLRNMSLSNPGKDGAGDGSDARESAEKTLPSHSGPQYYGTVTTEVQVTSSAILPPCTLPAYTNPFQKETYATLEATVTTTTAKGPSFSPPAAAAQVTARTSNNNNNNNNNNNSLMSSPTSDDADGSPRATTPTTFPSLPPSAFPPPPPPPPPPQTPSVLAHAPHNYPWSSSSHEQQAQAITSPAPTHLKSNSTSTSIINNPFSFPRSSPFSPARPGTRTFEATTHGFNNTAQYTTITADPSAAAAASSSSSHYYNNHHHHHHHRDDDRGPSPTRLLSPLSKRSTDEEGLARFSGEEEDMLRGDEEEEMEMGMNNHHHNKNNNSSPNQPLHHRQRNNKKKHKKKKNKNTNEPPRNFFRRMSNTTRRLGARLRHMDPVKLAYLRTSFVFAVSILVTWTPSSINRVYTLIYPDRASYGLNIAAAVVLPLQGVWNAVIYFTTSWRIFVEEMEASRGGRRLLGWLRMRPGRASRAGSGGGNDWGDGQSRYGHGGRGRAAGRGRGDDSFALGSSSGASRTDRGGMGTSRRLDGGRGEDMGDDALDERHGAAGVELQSPLSSPVPTLRRPSSTRMHPMGGGNGQRGRLGGF